MTATLAKRQLIEPDYWTCPHGIRVRPTATYGPAVAELCDKAGYTPDPQQELGLDLVFAIRPDGSPLAFSGCIICARQNLKSGFFQQCCIGWLFVTEVPEIAWSAHELRTSLNAQTELYRTLESPALSKYLPVNGRPNPGLYDTNGKERIELNTGQTVWFQTRTRDGGRGLGKPKVIIDEAFKFKKRTAGALLPILLAQHHPQLLYGSSEPPNDPDAEHLRDVMDRGQNHKSPSMWYLQWKAEREDCADPECTHPKDALARGLDCALDREHLLLQANPTVHRDEEGHALNTGRITMQTLRDLRQELDPDEYMRECLGWKDEEAAAGPPAINGKRWALDAEKGGPRDLAAGAPLKACVVIHTEPDRSVTSIGVAGRNAAGDLVVLEHSAPGEAWVAERLAKLRENIGVLEVALHPSGQAKTLIPVLKVAGINLTSRVDDDELGYKLTLNDLAGGCSSLLNKVENGGFVHLGQSSLDAAAAVARTKTTGQGQTAFVSVDSPVPMAPLVAASTALYRFELVESQQPDDPPPDIF